MTTPRKGNEDWRVKVRDWWYRVQDDCGGMMHSLPEFRRVEIETIIKQALTEKDVEVEKTLETKAMKVCEEEANEYNKIIEKEVEKARQDWLREEIVRLEGMKKRNPELNEYADIYAQRVYVENEGFNQALQTIVDRYQAELDQDVSK